MVKGLKKGLTNVASNLGIEKGASAVTNAVNVAKNGGSAYKKAMTPSAPVGERMAAKISEGKSENLKNLANDLKGNKSTIDVTRRLAEGIALDRNIQSKGPTLVDYASAGGTVAKDYLWDSASTGQRIARIGTVAAGYGVASGAARYVSGGSTMYNSKGERDIAGVPFM